MDEKFVIPESFYHMDMLNKKPYCMEFTNEEIIKHIVERFKNISEVNIRLLETDGEEISNEKEEIECVVLDGNIEEFYFAFIGYQTAIYVLNEEFMFIDDEVKYTYTSSDTYHNVVYEGNLRNKTHEEIFEILYKVMKICLGAKTISVEETELSGMYEFYPRCTYIVNLSNDSGEKSEVQIENILFKING